LLQKRREILHHNGDLFNPVIKDCDQFVVFLYEGNVHPGKIIRFNEEHVYISAIMRSLKRMG
jgi:hypothetical protein